MVVLFPDREVDFFVEEVLVVKGGQVRELVLGCGRFWLQHPLNFVLGELK